jgi:sugar phosphate isomerase/epimerase
VRIFANLSPFSPQILAGAIGSGRDLMREVDRHGFDGIEMNLAALSRPGGERLFEGLDYDRVTFHSNYFEFNPGAANPYVRDAAVRQLQDELAFASKRGALVVTFHPGARGKKASREESLENAMASVRRVVEQGAGILASGRPLLCVENMDANPEKLCGAEEELASMLERVPEIGLTLDLAHLGLRGLDVERFAGRFAGRIRHVHASGVIAGKTHGEVSLDESTVDFSAFVRGCAASDRIVCIENRSLELACASKRALERWARG